MPDAPAAVLWRAVTIWTRLHGIVSLEIERVWTAMGLDAERLLATEVDACIGTAAVATSTP